MPDAAHDQHLYARRHRRPGEIIAPVKRAFTPRLRRRPGRHHQRQVRVLLHRGLSHRGRQAERPIKGATLIGNGPSVMTRSRASATTCARRWRRGVRQGRPVAAGRRGPADAADRRLTVGGTRKSRPPGDRLGQPGAVRDEGRGRPGASGLRPKADWRWCSMPKPTAFSAAAG